MTKSTQEIKELLNSVGLFPADHIINKIDEIVCIEGLNGYSQGYEKAVNESDYPLGI